jgi:3-oxoacyl-[acyl-carrier protein] reductase
MAGETIQEKPSPSLPLDGRVAIITGGSRGIGRAITVHLRSLGAKVVINYASSSNQANLLVAELNTSSSTAVNSSSPPVAIAVRADVSNPDQVKTLFDRAEEEFGCQAHILVNCAGVLDPKYPTLANTTVEDWDMTLNVNAKGAFLCCREATNRLARGGGGRIIMITSSLVGSPLPGYAAYVASKAAVESMTKIVAMELKGSGITANCVAPGAVATEMFFSGKTEEMVKRIADACPLGRLGEADDISGIVGFLAGDAGEWINGQIIRANGGSVV